MPNYYDQMLAQLLGSNLYGPNEQAQARTDASGLEDEMIRRVLGSKRKASRSDKPGRYAMAEYPELWFATQGASQGLTPYGSGGIGQWLADLQTPGGGQRRDKERKDWARQQERILGRGGKEMSRSMAEKLSWMNRKRQLGRRR